MNQYPNSLDYYNYVNNNYNQPMFTENVDANKDNALYDPYQGFIRGNMFPKLYNGYKTNGPINLEPKNEQEEMLMYLDSLGFAAHDINLYLDIYPKAKDMIEAFKNYRTEANQVMEKYQQMYGPLFVNSEANTVYPWAWDNNPWPWEK
jgi:hypothetical protein